MRGVRKEKAHPEFSQMSFLSRLEKQKSIDLDPHEWDLSSKEYVKKFGSSSKNPKTVIPDPAIFRDAIVPSLKAAGSGVKTTFPNPGHLAAHLSLLECFLKFKESVRISDQLEILDLPTYSSGPSNNDISTSEPNSAPSLQRWEVILRLAVARFHIWFENIESTLRHAAAYHRFGPDSDASHATMTPNYLPPLDVLLVWYTYMQKPKSYQQDIKSHSEPKLIEIPLPWEAILAVIDPNSSTYTLPAAAQKLFTTTTKQSADILVYLEQPPPYTNLVPEKTFSVDLASAVHDLTDAGSFSETMRSLLWLRAPSLEGTLLRALARYGTLAQATENHAAIWFERVKSDPALELVWRTHMLYPLVYIEYSTSVFGDESLLEVDMNLLCPESVDSKDPEVLARALRRSGTGSDDGSISSEDTCYCWTCERIRDEDPNYVSTRKINRITDSTEDTIPVPVSPASQGLFRLRSRSLSQSSNTIESATNALSGLTQDQLTSIKTDLAFHHHVEAFRKSHPPGTILPTRPPTTRDIDKAKLERKAKDRAGTYYGMGYSVEVVRPAVYDQTTGRLLKKEKTKVTRKYMGPTGGMNGFLAGF